MSNYKYDKTLGLPPFVSAIGNGDPHNINDVAKECRACAIDSGFLLHDKLPQLVAFISEVGEWAEAIRKNDRANEIEEVVDIIVRIFAYAEEHFPNSWHANLLQKMFFNRNRPFKHGKEF